MTRDARTVRGAVLGVCLTGDSLPGLHRTNSAVPPLVEVIRVDAHEIKYQWRRANSPRRLFQRTFADGTPFVSVHHDETVGYQIWAQGFGEHVISADGGTVWSSLPAEAWRARRLLASQVFPLLSVLNGFEVLHAGAVVAGGKLVAVTAPSGVGKSSTLAHLLTRGAEFYADDALALDIDAEAKIVAYPGPRLLALDPEQLTGLSAKARTQLGRRLAEEGKVLIEPPARNHHGRGLDGMAFLERSSDAAAPALDTRGIDAFSLLGAASLGWLQRANRGTSQLRVAAAAAQGVPLTRVRIRPGEQAAEVADRIAAQLAGDEFPA